MGRPKGSGNKEKPANGPTPGDNGGGGTDLTDSDLQVLFNQSLGKLKALIEKKDEIVADIRNVRKKMIADGFVKAEIDFALLLEKEDPDEMLDRRRREARVARWLAHPIGTQNDLFADKAADRIDPVALGRTAGAKGETCKPPPHLNQDDAQRWITGWQEAQAALVRDRMKKSEAIAAADNVVSMSEKSAG
jgi:hypothetical protein